MKGRFIMSPGAVVLLTTAGVYAAAVMRVQPTLGGGSDLPPGFSRGAATCELVMTTPSAVTP